MLYNESQPDSDSGLATSLGLRKGSITYKQVLMFNPTYNKDENNNATKVKGAFSGMAFTEGDSYMLMTLNIDTTALMDKETTLLPTSIDATVFIDVDDNSYPTTLLFNNMTDNERDMLKAIINSNRTIDEGNTTLFDSTDALKNKILDTVIISLENIAGTSMSKEWTIRDVLQSVVKADGYGVRHSGNTLITGNYGGFILIQDDLTISG